MRRGLLAPLIPALLGLGCHDAAISSSGDGGSSTTTPTSSEGSSGGATGNDDSSSDDDSESGGPPVDVGDTALPRPDARFVADVITDGGHALVLHELKDGEPTAPVLLLPDTPLGATFRVTPLGVHDRLALDVRYTAGNRELFLVDWTSGETSVESLGTAAETAGLYYDDAHKLLLVRTNNEFSRFDPAEAAPREGVPALGDLAFGITFDESNPLFPVDGVVAAVGSTIGANLYLGSVLEPTAPTVQPTEFTGTARYPYQVNQLAGGHLVYSVGDYNFEAPIELHVLPRTHATWTTPQVVQPPKPLDEAYACRPRPHTDQFVYLVRTMDGNGGVQLMLGGVELGELAVPELLLDRAVGQLEFTAEGNRLVYRDVDSGGIEVIDFAGAHPLPARVLDTSTLHTQDLLSIEAIAPSGDWLLAGLPAPEAYGPGTLLRMPLDGQGSVEVIASEDVLRQIHVAPDSTSVAYVTQSTAGWVVRVVDTGGTTSGVPVTAAETDAPEINAIDYAPNGAWLSIGGGSGYDVVSTAVVVAADAVGEVVIELPALAGPLRWLP